MWPFIFDSLRRRLSRPMLTRRGRWRGPQATTRLGHLAPGQGWPWTSSQQWGDGDLRGARNRRCLTSSSTARGAPVERERPSLRQIASIENHRRGLATASSFAPAPQRATATLTGGGEYHKKNLGSLYRYCVLVVRSLLFARPLGTLARVRAAPAICNDPYSQPQLPLERWWHCSKSGMLCKKNCCGVLRRSLTGRA